MKIMNKYSNLNTETLKTLKMNLEHKIQKIQYEVEMIDAALSTTTDNDLDTDADKLLRVTLGDDY